MTTVPLLEAERESVELAGELESGWLGPGRGAVDLVPPSR